MVSKLTSLNSIQRPSTRYRLIRWTLIASLFVFFSTNQLVAQCGLNVFPDPGPPPFPEVTLTLGVDGTVTLNQDSLIGAVNPTGVGCSLYFYDFPGQAVQLGSSVVFSCDNSTPFVDGMDLFVVADDDGVPGGNESAPQRIRIFLEDVTAPTVDGPICGTTVSEDTDLGTCDTDVTITPPMIMENCFTSLTKLTIRYDYAESPFTGNDTLQPMMLNPIEGIAGADLQDSMAAWASSGFTRTYYSSSTENRGITVVSFIIDDATIPASDTCSFAIEISDDEDPDILCPVDTPVSTDPGSCDRTGIMGIGLSYFDNCSIDSTDYRLSGSTTTGWIDGDDAGGETFNLGLTTVTYRVWDIAGNMSSCSFTVTVTDETDPVITCPMDINLDVTTACDTTIALPGPVSMSDNCSATGDLIFSSSHDTLSSTFPVGVTTVTYQVMDEAGNIEDCTFDVTISDMSMPTVSCPAGQTLGSICASATFPDYSTLATVTDPCGTNMLTQMPAAGTDLMTIAGMGAMVFTDNGAAGLDAGDEITTTFTIGMSTCSFTVTLADNDVPVPDFSGPTLPQVDFVCGSTYIILAPTATDYVCMPASSVTIYGVPSVGMLVPASMPPAYEIPAGNWNILWTYEDADLNSVNQNQIVNVSADNVNPVITAMSPITVNLDASGMASVTLADFFASATDNCSVPSLFISPLSNTNFDCGDVGANSIDIFASDGTNTANITVMVNVQDLVDPVLLGVPVDETVECDAIPAPPVIGTDITATDNNGNCPNPGIGFSESSTRSFNPAFCNDYNYIITRVWTATDGSGNTTSFSQDITVEDNTAPVFSTTSAIALSTASGTCDANLAYAITSDSLADNCAPFANLDISYTINGGSSVSGSSFNQNFSQGVNTVVFTAIDPCGNAMIQTLTITVTDNTPPIASCLGGAPTVALPPSDTLILPASFINNGSLDACDGTNLILSLSQDTFTCFHADGVTAWPITLTVEDQSGNISTCNAAVVIQDNIDPTAMCQTSISVTLDNSGAASITSADIDNGSFDNCSSGGSLNLGLSQSTFGVSDLGNSPVDVILTVTDDNNNMDQCTTAVTVNTPETCFNVVADPPTIVTGTAATTVQVPVLVTNFVNVESLQFRAVIQRDTVAAFSGLTASALAGSGFITNIISPDTMNITWFNGGGNPPVTLADGSTVFFLEVDLIGDVLETSRIDIIGDIVVPFIVTTNYGGTLLQQTNLCADEGFVFINNAAQLDLGGQVYMETGAPVSLADVTLTNVTLGSTVGTQTTDGTGDFLFSPVSAGIDYKLGVSKDINWVNGVSALDLSLIQRHIVGIDTFDTPYKKVAADAFPDGSITVFDVVALNALLASSIVGPLVTPAGNTSWRFVPADFMFPSAVRSVVPSFPDTINLAALAADSLMNDFIAIKVGDVENNANPLALTSEDNDADARSTGTMTLTVNEQSLVAGEEYQLTFTAKGFEQLLAYQWVLDFDTDALSFVSTEGSEESSLGQQHFSLTATDRGKIGMIWYDVLPETMEEGAALFNVTFRANKDIEKLSEVLQIETTNLAAAAFNEDGESFDIDLIFFDQNTTNVSEFTLFQNRPNPFKEETIISFSLPEALPATVTVMDVSGRVIKVYEGDYAKGYNEFTIQRNELPANGVLFYQLDTPEHTAVKKMVLLK